MSRWRLVWPLPLLATSIALSVYWIATDNHSLTSRLARASLGSPNDDKAGPARSEREPPHQLQYKPIPRGYDTRVFTLLPGNYSDEIKIETGPMRSAKTDYVALSYQWMEEVPSAPIICDREKRLITANLQAALRRLRDTQLPLNVWADYICIDQINNSAEEKKKHLERMRDIYARARRVYVWLGEESRSDRLAFRALDSLSGSKPGAGWNRRNGKCRFLFGAGPDIPHIQQQHLIAFLSGRTWFGRTWVLQEVGSATDVTILYGGERHSWDELHPIWEGCLDHLPSVSGDRAQQVSRAIESVTLMNEAKRNHAALALSVFEIALRTSTNECKLQAEKIQAILKLARDEGTFIILEKQVSESDRAHAERVYKDFAVRDCKYNKSLRVLSCGSGPKSARGSTLSSWMPDWSELDNRQLLVRYAEDAGFSASGWGDQLPYIKTSQKDSVLHVNGILVDTVRSISQVPNFTLAATATGLGETVVQSIESTKTWIQNIKQMAGVEDQWDADHSSLVNMMKTLTCELTSDGKPAPKSYYSSARSYLGFREDVRTIHEKLRNECLFAPDGIPEVRDYNLRNHLAIDQSIRKWSTYRRFAVSTSGRFAAVPSGTREGDLICVLFGSEVPYVLRPAPDGHHEVVGESYVNGIMHGEALEHNPQARPFHLV